MPAFPPLLSNSGHYDSDISEREVIFVMVCSLLYVGNSTILSQETECELLVCSPSPGPFANPKTTNRNISPKMLSQELWCRSPQCVSRVIPHSQTSQHDKTAQHKIAYNSEQHLLNTPQEHKTHSSDHSHPLLTFFIFQLKNQSLFQVTTSSQKR